MRIHRFWSGTAIALVAGAALAGAVGAQVQIQLPPGVTVDPPTVLVPAPASSTTVTTGTTTVLVPATAPSIQAEEIRANEVRAQTIYANKIKAAQVTGTVRPLSKVKFEKTFEKLKAPQVTASVIYADEIEATSVVADQIFVRQLEKR